MEFESSVELSCGVAFNVEVVGGVGWSVALLEEGNELFSLVLGQ